jgi:trehalose/maltose transport system permease protein
MVTLYPLARTLNYSLTNARLTDLENLQWIGLENYQLLLRDPDWWQSVRNTAVFVLISVPIETLIGLVVALLLAAPIRGKGALRSTILIPWAIPAVVSARIWAWIFNDIYGVINELLRRLGWGTGEIAWLAEERYSLPVLIAVDIWKTTPFMALLLLAGIHSIPQNLHEAARVDGASRWQEFLHVTLPLLMPSLRVAILFRMLDALRIFDLPFVLTSNSKASMVMSIYARQQLVDFQETGLGSAASILIFCLTGVVALFYLLNAREQLGLSK